MSFDARSFPKARKPYRCSQCRRSIETGQRHLKMVHKSEITNDQVSQMRVCEPCSERYCLGTGATHGR
jgi:hypothetical protein